MSAAKPSLTVLLAFAPSLALAEETADAPSTSDTSSAYVAAGLSLSNTRDATFGQSSYLSTEFGLCRGAGCLALATGRADNDFGSSGSLSDYWTEAKASLAAPVGDYSAFGLLGVGNYLSTDRFFIEYGIGMSRSWDDVSVYAQASNWDGIWYVTPGVMLTL